MAHDFTRVSVQKDTLEIIVIVLGIMSTLIGVFGYLFLPRFRGFVWQTLENDVVRYDALRVSSFTRQTAAEKEAIRLMLHDKLTEIERLRNLSEANEDRIKYLDAVVIEQGKEIKQLPIIATAIQASAASIVEVARTMKEIHLEVIAHGKKLAGWDGFFEGQVAGERRVRVRRADDDKD